MKLSETKAAEGLADQKRTVKVGSTTLKLKLRG